MRNDIILGEQAELLKWKWLLWLEAWASALLHSTSVPLGLAMMKRNEL